MSAPRREDSHSSRQVRCCGCETAAAPRWPSSDAPAAPAPEHLARSRPTGGALRRQRDGRGIEVTEQRRAGGAGHARPLPVLRVERPQLLDRDCANASRR